MAPKITLLELERIDSTNRYAREHFDELADGTLVSAWEQTAGRGRRERVWQSPPGVNIYASLVVKTPGDAAMLGYFAGLSALETLRQSYPEGNFFIKWPNDVYTSDCKIAGVLCESARLERGRITGAVLGIGINVNLSPAILAELDQPAASLLSLSGIEFNRKKVLKTLENSLFSYYSVYEENSMSLFLEWRRANRLLGAELEVEFGDGMRRRGVFAEIAPDGALMLDTGKEMLCCRCGDVRIDRKSIQNILLKKT